jgi:His/Glu/Gln/Arg/opine family amino acid ABC transporter permease subunit
MAGDEAAAATGEPPPVADRARPDRGFGWFVREQTVVSAVVAVVGSAALTLLFVGTTAVLWSNGLTPSENLAAGITSDAQWLVLITSIVLGLAATVVGTATYRRMPTRPSRDAAISGAVLGIQAIALAGLFLWFRAGDVDTFARNLLEFQLLEDEIGRFFRAALNTLILALSGEALGILIGLALGVLVLSDHRVVRAPARTYINFFRGTPLLWQLSFFFFGIALGLQLNFGPYEVAIAVLGLNAGAYCAEIFRAGIQSIERGQFEAARSLGLSYFKALRLVILPQAIRRVIPPLTNEFVILIKDTSLVAVLGLALSQQELLATGRDIFSQTFNATPFLVSAAGYLAVTLPMIRVVTWLERRLRSGLTGIGP